MSLQNTASGDRIHISFFGRRNVGKSSLVNRITGQSLSVVSDVLGTTTDPVKKSMELLPLGPVVIIDTPGFDDEGELGDLRVKKTKEILSKTDIAVFVVDASEDLSEDEKEFLSVLKNRKIPYIMAHNKCDLSTDIPIIKENSIWVSAVTGIGVENLKEKLGEIAKENKNDKRIIADLLNEGDMVVLVTPIDESAPKGRLILPQQQTIRDILDTKATTVVCQVEELKGVLEVLRNPPKMVVTDSQAFGKVAGIVPKDIPLTSFSILFARYKGDLSTLVQGAAMLSKLKDGDKILIAEGCTHHRQCGDIGAVKMPAWIQKFSNANISFDFTSGGDFPNELSKYKLVVHCGGCMLNEIEMKNRIMLAEESSVPVVNYGVAIAHMNGILKRSIELFPDIFGLI